MRKVKTTLYFALALLPLLYPVLLATFYVGSEVNTEKPVIGIVEIVETEDGYVLTAEDGTIADAMLTPIYGDRAHGGVIGSFLGIDAYLAEHCGIPVSLLSVYAATIMVYYALLVMLDLLLSIVLFIPKRCGEILQ